LEDLENIYLAARALERIRNGESGTRRIGKPLLGSRLGEYWRYRVGDYLLICKIQDDRVIVLVLRVGNWRDIYR